MIAVLSTLAACGSGGNDASGSGASESTNVTPLAWNADQVTTQNDAFRLATQASFGASESLITEIQQRGPVHWLQMQFDATASVYPNGYDLAAENDNYCFLDSTKAIYAAYGPAPWDSVECQIVTIGAGTVQLGFWQQAVANPDQLRQRVAFMLSQVFVVQSGNSLAYGVRNYQQMLRDQAFGNYRDLLRKVTVSPMMGEWLNLLNSVGDNPNENYARELMELFTIGRCQLNIDGSLVGGACTPTYDDGVVHQYAKALSGWVYAQGPYPAGVSPSLPPFCFPATPHSCTDGRVSAWHAADMAPSVQRHNVDAQTLLSSIAVPANTTAPATLEMVLDSLMKHPNIAPFVAKHYIQFFVTSNPTPGYIQRVAQAFQTGSYRGLGSGVNGDLKATIAATLLDDEARNPATANGPSYGKLREPVLYMTASMRALNSHTDGKPFSGRYGRSLFPSLMWQTPFDAPSVFNFFHTSYPVPGANTLNGPEFEISNLNTNFGRANWADWLVFGTDWSQDPGTSVDLSAFYAQAGDADLPALVDRMDLLLTGGRTTAQEKGLIVAAAQTWPVGIGATPDYNVRGPITWQYERVANVAYLLMTTARYQIQR
jgi:uncharacterized protein (DUF1800 family)